MGISAVAIAIIGIITTIVVRARKVIKQGSKVVSSLAKAIANIAKKLGLVIEPILSLITQMLTGEQKVLNSFLKNLWLLAVALAYFVYNQYKQVNFFFL